jgi:hypothetical protein
VLAGSGQAIGEQLYQCPDLSGVVQQNSVPDLDGTDPSTLNDPFEAMKIESELRSQLAKGLWSCVNLLWLLKLDVRSLVAPPWHLSTSVADFFVPTPSNCRIQRRVDPTDFRCAIEPGAPCTHQGVDTVLADDAFDTARWLAKSHRDFRQHVRSVKNR